MQTLFDRGMILPSSDGKFHPNSYLNRDEFVGISMEVICERCIQPHTEYEFLEEYRNEDVYFDINNSNPYFYCVAEADKKNYVRGYDIGESCQNGTSKFDERPFCPLNRINLEEAVAVLLRNSGIFTINDNQRVVNEIRAGRITRNLAPDVAPTDTTGNPYTFYGYIEKALDYTIEEYDSSGNKKVYKLLEPDAGGNVNPQKQVTKQEFLRMAYIALKSNSCSEVVDNDLALAIDIWEKSCQEGDTNCTISELDDPSDTYDFTPDVEGYCEAGIDDPNGYKWRFYNTDNGDEFFHYGTYLDDITLPSTGEWKVFLTVRDRCGNTGEVFSTIMVEEEISVVITPWDESCQAGQNCGDENEIPTIGEEIPSGECDLWEKCDYVPEVTTTCELGTNESSYKWKFINESTGEVIELSGGYIDNYEFPTAGRWRIEVEVTDNCGKTATGRLFVTVTDIKVIIEPWDGVCVEWEICNGDNKIDDPIIVCDDEACKPTLPLGECDLWEKCDYIPKVATSCEAGIDESSYRWKFSNETTGEILQFSGDYIDDFEFPTAGKWRIEVEVTDNCGKTATAEVFVILTDISVIITPWDESCALGQECSDENEIVPEWTCIWPDCTQYPNGSCEWPDCVLVVPDGECGLWEKCDYVPEVTTSCTLGINESSYVWTFTNETTGEIINRSGSYIDNYEFETAGRWKIEVEVTDNCGKTASTTLYVNVISDPIEDPISLSVDILVDPIIWYEPLSVDFQWVVFGGTAPYDYAWNFGDTALWIWKNITHVYVQQGVYEVLLVVTDVNGLRGDATVLVKVLEGINCEIDSDGDGVNDCDDLCPTIPGTDANSGCPEYELSCGNEDGECGCPSWYSCSDSNPLTCGTGVCRPIEIDASCLYNQNAGSIFWNTLCTSCPCNSEVDFLADLRRCDIVFPAITSPDASSIYAKGRTWQVGE